MRWVRDNDEGIRSQMTMVVGIVGHWRLEKSGANDQKGREWRTKEGERGVGKLEKQNTYLINTF